MQTNVTSLKLNTGYSMPQIGLGVWQATGGDEERAVEYALGSGYTHIDTAAIYKNEEGVGRAINQAGIKRDDLFITTKLWNEDIRQRRGRSALEESLEKLQLDYVDLYLLHWPVDGGIEAWRALEKAQADGLVKSIGLSNYMPEHIEELMAATDVIPAVNQIEFHPYNQQLDVLEICGQHDIKITAWSPLMQGNFKDEPLLNTIGNKYGKTGPQVLLRWDLQRGVITIPKSVNQGRIQQNIDVLDFELSAEDMAQLNGLNRENGRFGPDPRDFNF